jgi:hypothetical protein
VGRELGWAVGWSDGREVGRPVGDCVPDRILAFVCVGSVCTNDGTELVVSVKPTEIYILLLLSDVVDGMMWAIVPQFIAINQTMIGRAQAHQTWQGHRPFFIF